MQCFGLDEIDTGWSHTDAGILRELFLRTDCNDQDLMVTFSWNTCPPCSRGSVRECPAFRNSRIGVRVSGKASALHADLTWNHHCSIVHGAVPLLILCSKHRSRPASGARLSGSKDVRQSSFSGFLVRQIRLSVSLENVRIFTKFTIGDPRTWDARTNNSPMFSRLAI